MKVEAQSRQRNSWERGDRNKWNRTVDGFNENTPWRVSRDKYYDFTHYYVDELKFDEDPNHIYSGEALWRTYIMDKFYRDYKDKDGHVVGGYVNDRFHVFPTAGTPANPDAPRDGGNQMGLADGERDRQPRPHEYSVERRLEEQRGNKTESIVIASNKSAKAFSKVVKLASANYDEIQSNKVYQMMRDALDMKEANIEYQTILEAMAEHYNTSILSVSQIYNKAKRLAKKHQDIGYVKSNSKSIKTAQYGIPTGSIVRITEPNGVIANQFGGSNQAIALENGTVVTNVDGDPSLYQIVDHPNPSLINQQVVFQNMDFNKEIVPQVQEAADELGLNEAQTEQIIEAVETDREAENI